MQKDLIHGAKRRSAKCQTPDRTGSRGRKDGTPNALLGVVFKSWRSSQHCGAMPRTRHCLWHNTVMTLESSTVAAFTSSSSAPLTFLSCLCLFKSSLVAVGKCQSIMCNDGAHSQSAQGTEFQVFV